MDKLFANSEVPDQTPRSAASDLCLHCLLINAMFVNVIVFSTSYCGALRKQSFVIVVSPG